MSEQLEKISAAKKVGLARLAKNLNSINNQDDNSGIDKSYSQEEIEFKPTILVTIPSPTSKVPDKDVYSPISTISAESSHVPESSQYDSPISSSSSELYQPLDKQNFSENPIEILGSTDNTSLTEPQEDAYKNISSEQQHKTTSKQIPILRSSPQKLGRTISSDGAGQIHDDEKNVGKIGFFESIKRRSFRRKTVHSSQDNIDRKESLPSTNISLDNQLVVPKLTTRSRSLSRLSDAFGNINNVCLFPSYSLQNEAKRLQKYPAISTGKLNVASDFLSSSYLCKSNHQVPNSSFVLQNSESPNLSRLLLPFPNVESPHSHNRKISVDDSPKSFIISPNTLNNHDSHSYYNKLSERTLSHSDISNLKKHKRKHRLQKRLAQFNNEKRDSCSSVNESINGSESLGHVHPGSHTIVSKDDHLMIKPCLLPLDSSKSLTAKDSSSSKATSTYSLDQSNEGSSFESSDEFESQECEETASELSSTRKWSSLTRLSNDGSPLGTVRTADARQRRNYLFGGLGSLLGPTELERYFPNRNVTIFIATWNMNGKEPPTSLDDFLLPDDLDHMPDLYVVGTQEFGGDKTEWEVRLQTTIGPSHVLFTSAILGILHLTVFLRRDLVWFCTVPEETFHSLRPGTYFKTKGAIGISFQFFGTKMLFINTHLFAHEEKLAQRIQNYHNIIYNLDVPRNLRGSKMQRARHRDVTNRYDVVFWLGDLNFRLVGDREKILNEIKMLYEKDDQNLHDLMQYDQLTQARNNGDIFHGFNEGPIHFTPTFKFDIGTNSYDSSSKQRIPSYTDRILFKSSRDPIVCFSYNSCPLFRTSDHKPVCGVFSFKARPGKDDVPLAAGLFNRDVYLAALKRRRKFFHQPSSRNCQVQ